MKLSNENKTSKPGSDILIDFLAAGFIILGIIVILLFIVGSIGESGTLFNFFESLMCTSILLIIGSIGLMWIRAGIKDAAESYKFSDAYKKQQEHLEN